MRRRKMCKLIVLFVWLFGYCGAVPLKPKRNVSILREEPLIKVETAGLGVETEQPAHGKRFSSTLTLPSNATSIRTDITDGFSCDNRPYGYYADVENDCQIFHVCLPVTYANGKENVFRWSFICPEETAFSQDSFTCMRPEDMSFDCSESYKYYDLNRNFGTTESETDHRNSPQGPIQQRPMMNILAEEETAATASAPPAPIVHSMKQSNKAESSPKVHRNKPVTTQRKPVIHYPLRKVSATPVTADSAPLKAQYVVPFITKRRRPSPLKNEATLTLPEDQNVPPAEVLGTENSAVIKETAMKETATAIDEPVDEKEPTLVVANDVVESEVAHNVVLPPAMEDSASVQTTADSAIQKSEEESVIMPMETDNASGLLNEIPVHATETENTELLAPSSNEAASETHENVANNIENSSVSKILEVPVHTPGIFESNSEEEAITSIQKDKTEDTTFIEASQGEEKETILPPTEILNHDTIASESKEPNGSMLLEAEEDNSSLRLSMGGFKPVEPVRAAEAEALITDFINTLIKAETPTAKPPTLTNDIEANEEENSSIGQEDVKLSEPIEEALLAKPEETEMVDRGQEQPNDSVIPPAIKEKEVALAMEKDEKEGDTANSIMKKTEVEIDVPSEAQTLKNSLVATFPMMNSFSADMFQIPVTVIHQPMDEVQQVAEKTTESKINSVPVWEAPSIHSVSRIKDIVELVKERLDQAPPAAPLPEQPGTGNDIIINEKDEAEELQTPADAAPEIQEEETEAIILPMFDRLTHNNANNLSKHKTISHTATESLDINHTEIIDSAKPVATETAETNAANSDANSPH